MPLPLPAHRPPDCSPALPALCGRSGPRRQARLSPLPEAPTLRVRRRSRAWRILFAGRWDAGGPRNGPGAGTVGLERMARRVAVERAREEQLAWHLVLGPSRWEKRAGRAGEGRLGSGAMLRPRSKWDPRPQLSPNGGPELLEVGARAVGPSTPVCLGCKTPLPPFVFLSHWQ